MRHGKRFNHLSRKAPHRKAMLSNMASSLILHKKIETTLAKAKALRKYVEPLLTNSIFLSDSLLKFFLKISRENCFLPKSSRNDILVICSCVFNVIVAQPKSYY